MSDTAPNEDDEPQIPREQIDAIQGAAVLLEEAAQKMGLYAQTISIAVAPPGFEHEEAPKVMLVGQFLIGDVAFSDRVQNPEQDATEDTFREIASGAAKDEFEALREKMAKRVAEGLPPMGGDEDG